VHGLRAIGGIVSRGSETHAPVCRLMPRCFHARPPGLANALDRCDGNSNGQPCCPDAYDRFVRIMVFKYHSLSPAKMLGYHGPGNGFPAAVRKARRDKLIDFS